jgi:hypothetical protein
MNAAEHPRVVTTGERLARKIAAKAFWFQSLTSSARTLDRQVNAAKARALVSR